MFFRDSLSSQDACQIKGLQTFCLDAVGDTSQHENETQSGNTLADFLHKKKHSSLWYYRRRYPKDVAQKLGAAVFMKSLKTSVKRDAEKLSRQLSVEFDTVCHEARLRRDAVQALSEASVGDAAQELRNDAATVLSEVPQL